ncbi:MAG TPA: hypothetical protein VJS65_11420 [Verrucomicrobiae bacterium]|nr:hypothetical protein [Verrucomicrobiae bacterium]
MKKFIHKIQDLGQKAAHLKQVVDAAPAKAAQIRESMLMTAGQLQQLRHDVQSTATGLRADNDDRLAQALREIDGSAETFLEAGYELTGVDLEASPTQRLIVHLEKLESVSESTLRTLLSANSGRQTVYALLAALAKADALSEKVTLSNLSYRELIVHVGSTPTIRLCWRTEAHEEDATAAHVAPHAAAHTPGIAPTAAAVVPPPLPAFSQSSYFEHRTTPTPPTPPAPQSAPEVSTVSSSMPAPEAAPAGSHWNQSALERFKKMPDVSKYRR